MTSTPSHEADQERVLHEVMLELGSSPGVERLLALVVERVAGMVNAERAVFALIDPQGRVRHAVAHNLRWDGPGHPLPVSHGVIAEVVRERRTLVIRDATTHERFSQHKSVRALGLRLVVCVPVIGRERVLGVLYVDSTLGVLDEMDDRIEFLDSLARIVGVAVEHAELFEEQRYRNALLAAQVHELRTPLTVVKVNASLLETTPAGHERLATRIAASTCRMERMIDRMLDLSRIDAGAVDAAPREVDVVAVARERVAEFEPILAGRQLTIEVTATATTTRACTVREHVGLALDNLLSNAIKHAAPGTRITVTVACRADAGPDAARRRPADAAAYLFFRVPSIAPADDCAFLDVSVHNHGPHIPAHLLEPIFSAYVRGERQPLGVHPTGLGLSIVDQCARNLGGCAWAESSPSEGTAFHFTLPTGAVTASGGAAAPKDP